MAGLPGFIELDRRFRELSRDVKPEDEALSSYTRFLLGDAGLGWKDILNRRLVVVLGEPGSGKTWEFAQRAAQLNAEGQIAFLIRLDQLVGQSLAQALGSNEYKRFQRWHRSSLEAIFLLDSVDEAKFLRVSDFYAALSRLSGELGSAGKKRAKILVSSRISEWQPYTDERDLLQCFPCPPPKRERTSNAAPQPENSPEYEKILIVQIEPLDDARVERFALGRGVVNVQAFRAALEEHHAWDFARRPVDVVDLINYWSERGRLGSLTELIEFNVQQNLRPSNRDRHDPLSEERGQKGAEYLGAATVFCRQFGFKIPDDALLVTNALDASTCLPQDWHKDDCRALLTRPIFDSESYGRIRFHHRRVAEFLAARWLAARINDGCPVEILGDLLFEYAENRRVLRPALAPVTAWLCCGGESWNRDVRCWVLEAAPNIHLQYGDPSGLPLEYKRSLLNSLVQRFAGRQRVWLESSSDSLSRLADLGLADDVAKIIRNAAISTDLRAEMLLLARHGRLQACLEVAFEVIVDPVAPDKLKSYAAALIRDVGDSPSRQRLAEIAARMPSISTRICAQICEALYPGTIIASDLASLLRKTDQVPRHDSMIFQLKSHIEAALKPDDSGELLAQLVQLVQTPPCISLGAEVMPVSEHFSWVGEMIPAVLEILFSRPQLTHDEEEIACVALWLLGYLRRCDHPHHYEKLTSLQDATVRHPRVRQHYLWRIVEEWRQEHQEEPSGLRHLFDTDAVLKPLAADLEWLVDDITGRDNLRDNQLALLLSVELWDSTGRGRRAGKRIRRAAASNRLLKHHFRQSAAGGRWVWIKRIWYQDIRYKIGDRWWWLHRFREADRWVKSFRWKLALLCHLKLLASGRPIGWLRILVQEAEQTNSSKWAPKSWESLRRKRGRLIANAATEGCQRVWRQHVPLLPHDKPQPLQTDYRVIIGLAGLQASITDGDIDLSSLSHPDAVLATRYAVNELNGFAPWLDELAMHCPEAVREILADCIQGEWQFSAEREHSQEVLADLAWSGERLAPIVQDAVLSLLRSRDPRNPSILKFALTVLVKLDHAPLLELAALAEERIRKLPPNEMALILWMSVWLQSDGGKAIDRLEEILSRSDRAGEIMVRLCAALSNENVWSIHAIANPSYMQPAHLARFIPLVYRHIALSHDIHREEMVAYSVGDRDLAQRFRDGLLNRLANSESPNAGEFLQSLANNSSLAALRDWILQLRDEWIEKQANLPVWNPLDIRTFAKKYEIEPKTDTDLFKILNRRLLDIKHDVEKADTSIRQDLHTDDDEIRLRKWFANQLKTRSDEKYTVPQEEEIDQRQKPDLRIQNPKVRGPVSIEIKWADKWSLAELYDRLENQLIGQYLRDANARYGVYLLGYIGRQQYWWHPENRQRLTFGEVVQALEVKAKLIVTGRADVREVRVIAIDFRHPKEMTVSRC
jgi:hypothetical protein